MGKWNISHRRHGKARCLSLLYLICLRWSFPHNLSQKISVNIFVINDRYFMIATVPDKVLLVEKGGPRLYHVISLQRALAGFSSQTSTQGSCACTQFGV